MKLYILLLCSILSLSLMQCKSTIKTKAEDVTETPKIKFEPKEDVISSNVYFQKWTSQENDGESGIHIFFPELAIKHNYTINNVYFRNKVGKIISGKASSFASLTNNKTDIIMSNHSNAEYGNTLPNTSKNFPFQLKDSECVVSYSDGQDIKYYKIENVIEKRD